MAVLDGLQNLRFLNPNWELEGNFQLIYTLKRKPSSQAPWKKSEGLGEGQLQDERDGVASARGAPLSAASGIDCEPCHSSLGRDCLYPAQQLICLSSLGWGMAL